MFIPFGFMAGTPAPSYDTDAQAFFTAVEGGGDTLTTTEKNAVNALVVDLKVGNEWSNAAWIYPFVGGTASSMKWNLKDPQDTAAAYRLLFGTAITYSSLGIKSVPNNNQSYADTNYNPVDESDTENIVSLYLNQNMGASGDTPGDWYDFGGFDGSREAAFIMGYNDKATMYTNVGSGFRTAGSGWTYVNDLFTATADGSNVVTYQGTTTVINRTRTFFASDIPMTICGSNRTTGITASSGRGYGFGYYSNNLTGFSISNLNSAVQTFVTALGRD